MDTESILWLLNYFFAPASEKITNVLCRNHSIVYLYALLHGAPWASKMWDSTAKIQTGLLTGNLNSFGNYDECLNIGEVEDVYGNFSGKYCLTTLKLDNTTAGDALGKTMKRVMAQEEEINSELGELLSKGLRWGFCMPSSCSYEDLRTGLSEVLQNRTKIQVEVDELDCSDSVYKPYSTGDWLIMSVFILLFLTVLLSSGYEFFKVYYKTGLLWNIEYPSECSSDTTWRPNSSITVSTTTAPPSPEEEVPTPLPEGTVKNIPPPEVPATSSSIADRTCPKSAPERPKTLTLKYKNAPARVPIDLNSGSFTTTSYSSPDSPISLPSERECDILSSFSIFSNGIKLFSLRESKIIFSSMDGIKVLTLCWVVFGHACLITESLPAINYISVRKHAEQWPAIVLLNTQLAADTFLVCTGAIICFTFLKDMKKRGIYRRHSNSLERTGMTRSFLVKYIPLYYLHRYIRFTPALLAMILLQLGLSDHFGSGPFWNTGSSYFTRVCRDTWWGSLLYIENYVDGNKICLPQSWYMMVDMQLYIVSPILLLMFLCWTKRRALNVSAVLILIGVLVTFLVSYFLDLPAGFLLESKDWLMKVKYDYVATHTRFAPWMIGMVLGYLLYYYKRRELVCPEMPRWSLRCGWVFAPISMLYAVFGLKAYQDPEVQCHLIWESMYSAGMHSFWALGVAWIIFCCETNHAGMVQGLLTFKIFRPLSRLTYCIYLVHVPLMMYRALTVRVPMYIDGTGGMLMFFGDLSFSTLLAVFLALFVEMPFVRLFRAVCIKMNCTVRYTPQRSGRYAYAPLCYSTDQPQPSSTKTSPRRESQDSGTRHSDNIAYTNMAGTSKGVVYPVQYSESLIQSPTRISPEEVIWKKV